MQKLPLKMKMIMFTFMIVFMVIYSVLFGSKNAAIGIMIAMAGMMNLGNDMSFKPKVSFIKLTVMLLILGIASFLNNPISILGCILTFLVVFGATFTSYHLFSTSVYIPYLMCYFMMMCIPISAEELPMRLISLIFGAAFIVGINLLINKKKGHKLTKATLDSLILELNNAIDSKQNNEKISKESFKAVNGFYLSMFSHFEYKYFPTPAQEAVLNVIKAFQYIGWVIADSDLTDDELNYTKSILNNLESIEVSEIFKGIDVKTKEMNLILLNLEIIVNEIKKWDSLNDGIIPDKKLIRESIKPILKREFSFRSAKFTFAFKMALVLTLWEVLTLAFNLPYTKWLYFASIPMMLPYVNDAAYNAKSRVTGTIVGVFIFALIIILMHYIPLSQNILMMLIMVISIFGMVYELEDTLKMTIFSTLMSVMTSLMYITLPEALTLKIIWVIVAVIVVSAINFGFLPYSVEKETKNNLKALLKLNESSIGLIRAKCMNKKIPNKTTLLIVSNLIRENIEVTDENREIYWIQMQITDISNFILNYLDVHDFSGQAKDNLIRIIEHENACEDYNDIYEKIMFYSTEYVVNILDREKELFEDI
ncbi:MAG: FUSC family protein [Methanobrevibacter sp.]|uniref:FUSC family protein n=1 Tax=Methanobrevibacter sp. TaxID=66852 RepID=UPI0025E679ED|nr:FUSC family protein [Methanobrevibacter sp.]MBQ8016975.1 FUSC family protein [Methanobrevibacter sp.]